MIYGPYMYVNIERSELTMPYCFIALWYLFRDMKWFMVIKEILKSLSFILFAEGKMFLRSSTWIRTEL